MWPLFGVTTEFGQYRALRVVCKTAEPFFGRQPIVGRNLETAFQVQKARLPLRLQKGRFADGEVRR